MNQKIKEGYQLSARRVKGILSALLIKAEEAGDELIDVSEEVEKVLDVTPSLSKAVDHGEALFLQYEPQSTSFVAGLKEEVYNATTGTSYWKEKVVVKDQQLEDTILDLEHKITKEKPMRRGK